MLTYLTRWMRDFRVDGIRMDSVENVANWDFVQAFKDLARTLWRQRWVDAGLDPAVGADARFLVVGDELTRPPGLLRQSRLDGLWNNDFQSRIRAASGATAPTATISNGPCERRSTAVSAGCSPTARRP
jgi:hypothetical protein